MWPSLRSQRRRCLPPRGGCSGACLGSSGAGAADQRRMTALAVGYAAGTQQLLTFCSTRANRFACGIEELSPEHDRSTTVNPRMRFSETSPGVGRKRSSCGPRSSKASASKLPVVGHHRTRADDARDQTVRGFHGTKALLVQADLRNSITVVKDGDRVLVGVLRTARNGAGKSLVDLAAPSEIGSRPIAVRLTPKARAFLHAAFRHAGLDRPSSRQPGTGIAIIQIPPRPFLAPVFDKYAQRNRFRADSSSVLLRSYGDFGRA